MIDTDKDPQENIEQCFEEIKQVLKKYGCEMYVHDNTTIVILAKDSQYFMAYD